MQTTPLVSVIIPTYNRANYLVQAMASVEDQLYTKFELLVADDGSTDDTRTRVAAQDGPIRYLALEHSGRPSIARNRALALARGELIAFLDDDDLWQPEKLQQQVGLLVRQPSLGFVYCDLRFLYADGTRSTPVLQPHQKRNGDIFSALIGGCFIHPSTVVVRRTLLDAVGRFDEAFAIGEDYDLWLRLAYKAHAGFLSQPLALIRRHPTEISRQRELETYQNTITLLKRLPTRFSLSLRQRLYLRRSLARLYAHVGLAQVDQGDAAAGRRHFFRSLRLNPVQRRGWTALLNALSGRRV